jgi:hypothetical protein
MESFVAFIIVAVIVVVYVAVQKSSPSNQQAKAVNEALSRVGTAWDRAPADKRNRILSEAGINSISVRNTVIVQPWAQLSSQFRTAITFQSSLVEQLVDGFSTKDQSTGQHTKQSVPETDNNAYFDAFFALAMRLSRSLSLSEWKTGIPQGYTHEETECIEATRQGRSRLKYTTASRFVEEPLQKLLCEIGLMNWAREDRTCSYDEWGRTCPPRIWSRLHRPFLRLGFATQTHFYSWSSPIS